MIDMHTHILPGIDDGCTDPEESLLLLRMLKRQGVTTACLTPHFYAEKTDPTLFLKKRQESFRWLIRSSFQKNIDGKKVLKLPIRLKLGAEVLYFTGISQTESIKDLCYEGTNVLLLEMPFHAWSDQMINEILSLQIDGHIQVCLAHIDRYWDHVPEEVFSVLKSEGVRFQLNCDSLLTWKSRRKALRAVKDWQIDYLTSDTHHVAVRAPKFDEAFAILEKKKLFSQCAAFRKRSIWKMEGK